MKRIINSPYRCYCGKYRGLRAVGIICDKCGVQVSHYHSQEIILWDRKLVKGRLV